MELADILTVLWRYARSIAAVLLVSLGIGAAMFAVQKPVYASSGTLFFTVNPQAVAKSTQAPPAPGREYGGDLRLQQEMAAAVSQAKTYEALARTPVILDPAGQRLEKPLSGVQLADHVQVAINDNTAGLTVTAQADTPQTAAGMAEAVLDEIIRSAKFYAGGGATVGVSTELVIRPEVPSKPSSPGLARDLVLWGALGAVLAVTQAFVRARTSRRLRTPADAVLATHVPLIAEIPLDRTLMASGGGIAGDPFGPRTEAIRRLRTNLDFLGETRSDGTWLVTSAVPGEGKTTTAIGLAQSFADAERSVVLVDADLRRPHVADALGLPNGAGLAETLRSDDDVCDRVLSAGGFDVLPAGEPPRNPAELLDGARMVEVLERLQDVYDVVIVDSAPVLPAADTVGLSRIAGSVILVAASGGVRRGQLQKALQSLTNVDADLAGVVLNKLTSSSAGVYGASEPQSYAPRRAIRSELGG